MKITKFAGRSCVKCKVLDKVLSLVTLPCEVETRYVEDESNEAFVTEGVMSLPTLVLEEGDKKIILQTTITPKMIEDALNQLQA